MDEKAFEELTSSLKEAVAIAKGEKKASRVNKYEDIDVASIRKATHLSNEETGRTLDEVDTGTGLVECNSAEDMFNKLGV